MYFEKFEGKDVDVYTLYVDKETLKTDFMKRTKRGRKVLSVNIRAADKIEIGSMKRRNPELIYKSSGKKIYLVIIERDTAESFYSEIDQQLSYKSSIHATSPVRTADRK